MSFANEILELRKTLDLLEEEQKKILKHLELLLPDKLSALKQLVSGKDQEKDLISRFKIQTKISLQLCYASGEISKLFKPKR